MKKLKLDDFVFNHTNTKGGVNPAKNREALHILSQAVQELADDLGYNINVTINKDFRVTKTTISKKR